MNGHKAIDMECPVCHAPPGSLIAADGVECHHPERIRAASRQTRDANLRAQAREKENP